MLKLTIVGCGAALEDLHVAPLLRLQRSGALQVRSLVDANHDRAARFRSVFREAAAFSSLDEAYAKRPTELTLIASPPAFHLKQGLTALAAGSHVLMEKPLVPTSAAADEIVARARAAGRVLTVALPRRFFPWVSRLASIVANGDLGTAITYEYREGSVYDWPVATDAPFRREAGGGGVLLDKGAHVIDTLDQVFGPGEFAGAEDDCHAGGVESNSRVRIRHRSATGTAQLSWDQPLNNGFWIQGAGQELWVELSPTSGIRRRSGTGPWQIEQPLVSWPSDVVTNGRRLTPIGYHDCIFLEWTDFLRAVALGEKPVGSADSTAGVMRVIETSYEKATALEFPWLTTNDREANTARHWRAGR
jgi:predicted dehydrogenase